MSYLFLAPGTGSASHPLLGKQITSHCQGQPQSYLFPITILNIFYLIRFPVGWGKLPFLITSCYPRFPSPHPQYIFCHACLLFCVKRLCMPGGRLNVSRGKKKHTKKIPHENRTVGKRPRLLIMWLWLPMGIFKKTFLSLYSLLWM